jgi:3-oxoacyl-(acyl-carrier-protein) synthase
MEPVVITGFGVVSPLGNSAADVTQRWAAGHQPTGDDRRFVEIVEIPMAAVPADKQARSGRLDRLCRFFLAASYLAVDAAGLTINADAAHRVGLSFGTGLGCLLTNAEYFQKVVEQGPAAASPRLFAYTVSSAAAGEVSIALGITGPNVTAHMGFAAGLGAVGYGFDLIQMGKADVVLAGGADVIGPALVTGLQEMGLLKARAAARPFRDAVPGVFASEAAVVLVLERRDHARRRGGRCWGCIEGYAAGFEPTLTRAARQSTGIAATLRRALALSGHAPADVGVVMASAHGTPVDDTERAALTDVFGADSAALVLAPKAAFGECFAASGVLALALSCGLVESQPTVADGLAYAVDGAALVAAEVARRLRATSVAMINSLCYSGDVVSLVVRHEAC